MKPAWIIVAAGGVLAAGIWLGHATNTSSEAAPAPAPLAIAAPAHTAPTPRAQPALQRKTTPGLAADLTDNDPKVRRAALGEAVKAGEADPQLLLAASRDPDLGVAIFATTALGKAYANGEVPVQEMVARVSDKALPERVRVAASNGLGVVASPEAARLFSDLAVHGDTLERRTAVILLQHQDADLAIPVLIDAFGDADEYVRANALESLRALSRGRDFGTDANAWRAWWQARPRN